MPLSLNLSATWHLLLLLTLLNVCATVAQEACAADVDQVGKAASLMQVKQMHHARAEVRHSGSKKMRRLGEAPCSCHAEDATWTTPAQRAPRCVFIDLGAADGNTWRSFLEGGFGSLNNCPSGGSYQAILVEANPRFAAPLQATQTNYSGIVRSLESTAAYMCEGTTSFFLDTVDVETNFWGSSLSPNHSDVIRSGRQQVTVPLVNVARLLVENTLPDDYVLLKMDIEGAEHDILPCLANSQASKLIDALFLEKHPTDWSLGNSDENITQRALTTLEAQGVWVPEYFSPTL